MSARPTARDSLAAQEDTKIRIRWAAEDSKMERGFCAGSKMMLDGGSSTGLIVDGASYITPSNSLPQVFIIYSGK